MSTDYLFSDDYKNGFWDGKRETLDDIQELIRSDLNHSKTLHADEPGLRKALLIIERLQRAAV